MNDDRARHNPTGSCPSDRDVQKERGVNERGDKDEGGGSSRVAKWREKGGFYFKRDENTARDAAKLSRTKLCPCAMNLDPTGLRESNFTVVTFPCSVFNVFRESVRVSEEVLSHLRGSLGLGATNSHQHGKVGRGDGPKLDRA